MILSRNNRYPDDLPYNLENVRPTFVQDSPNAIRFNLVHFCPSILLFPFAVFLSFCSTVLGGNCNVSFYFLHDLATLIKRTSRLFEHIMYCYRVARMTQSVCARPWCKKS